MISFQIGQLYDWINGLLWPLFRIAGLVALAPVLGESSIPMRVKIGLSIALTLIAAPLAGPMPQIAPASWSGLLIAAQQVLIGMALGLSMRLVFTAVMMAGEFVGLKMGLAFASFFDPATGANTAVLSRLMNVVAMLVFLAVNGHLLMLDGLVRTFDLLPVGAPLMTDGWGALLDWSAQLWVSGTLLALPLVIVLLTINLAMGILNRTAQQLSVFAIGFPISLTTGLITLAIVVPQSGDFLASLFEGGYQAMARIARSLAGM
ncbi:flagellar biosynthetic protein FliR [Castellaniella defragrans]|jgi:flagellar biosynthetic protein FliR|uniref:Flagellar biosynthetic protein FliR n=2 Tax=Castellaniella defragrans TaxID=75697 RepID=W8X9H1_CASD6|nr:flagellar biosynthetic protein FliR [Castellaniella defragrans]KAB0600432.1 flagellar biosynthetic protein FliR [Castellaniella defragrans]MBB6082392.1 flagellar biosynthetic protein FliR [Castellaniella defragrans]CDM24815.1 Flagellar biosynthesis protein FliR [Castellaniella defragrans 65Phen]